MTTDSPAVPEPSLFCQCDHGVHYFPPQGPDDHDLLPVPELFRADNGLLLCACCTDAGHGLSLLESHVDEVTQVVAARVP